MIKDFSRVWQDVVKDTLEHGTDVAPRGQPTLEMRQRTINVDMRYPVLRIPERKLSYQFLAAEAYWILSGDDRVATISPYNKHIEKFSDDGKVFFGAYGPKIKDQLGYVVDAIKNDIDTRQAGLTIWRENPSPSKDIPCTVAIFFNVRDHRLNCHVFMRSSDVWLGIPYDVFNFSMLSHLVCCQLGPAMRVSPGVLHLTAASSHLYKRNADEAEACSVLRTLPQAQTPKLLSCDELTLMEALAGIRESKPGSAFRWWERTDD